MLGHCKEAVQLSDSTGGDHVELTSHALDLGTFDRDVCEADRLRDPSEELRTKPARLDQCDRISRKAGDYDPGKPGARADVSTTRGYPVTINDPALTERMIPT